MGFEDSSDADKRCVTEVDPTPKADLGQVVNEKPRLKCIYERETMEGGQRTREKENKL